MSDQSSLNTMHGARGRRAITITKRYHSFPKSALNAWILIDV